MSVGETANGDLSALLRELIDAVRENTATLQDTRRKAKSSIRLDENGAASARAALAALGTTLALRGRRHV